MNAEFLHTHEKNLRFISVAFFWIFLYT
jgi:hypothetical protein